MAASLNYINEGTQLISGNKLLVTVDIFSENVLIVSGYVGSRKYYGALLGSTTDLARPFVPENVFNWDYSLKNNFPCTNLCYKSIHTSDTCIVPSKLLSGSGYICANCKKKLANNHKDANKEPSNNIIYESDIILLKQALSYPELTDTKLSNNPTLVIDKEPIKLTPSNSAPRKLKRKKSANSNSVGLEKRTRLVPLQDKSLNPKIPKMEMSEDRHIKESVIVKTSKHRLIVPKPESVVAPCHENYRVMPQTLARLNNISSVESNQEMEEFFNREFPKPKKIWMKMIENEDSQKTCESDVIVNSLESLNSVSLVDAIIESLFKEPSPCSPLVPCQSKDSSSEDACEGLPSLSVLSDGAPPPPPPLDSFVQESLDNERALITIDPNKDTLIEDDLETQVVPNMDYATIEDRHGPLITADPTNESKPIVSSKFSCFNRSYKIKQTLHDKVILTIERPSSFNHSKKVPPLINDIYSFTDDDDLSKEVLSQTHSHHNAIIPLLEQTSTIDTCIDENERSESLKSAKTNLSRKSRSSKKTNANKIDKIVFEQNLKLESKEEEIVNDGPPLNSCENSVGTLFKLEDVVWAKITGYPYWPARIMSFNRDDDMFVACIEWYAWKEVSFIKVNNLFHFKEYYQSKYQRKKRNCKYQEAVKQARVCCGMLDVFDSLAAEDFGTLCSTKDSDSESESNEGSGTSVS